MAKKIILPEKIVSKIVSEYQRGDFVSDIAIANGVSNVTVYKYLAKQGIPLRPLKRHVGEVRQRKLSFEQREEIAYRYGRGETLTSIAREYGVTHGSLIPHLRNLGVTAGTSRRIEIDESCFDTINPDSAYWVGFLMADGCVTDRGYLSLCLAIVDKTHVQKFAEFLHSKHTIKHRVNGTSKQAQLHIISSSLCAALSRYGVVPRKTHCAKVIGLEDNRDFWRGMIDGDGSLGEYKGSCKKLYPQISLCGTPEIIEQFRQFCLVTAPSITAKASPRNVITVLTVRGINALRIIRVLYEGAQTALDRKAKLADRLLSKYEGTITERRIFGAASKWHSVKARR